MNKFLVYIVMPVTIALLILSMSLTKVFAAGVVGSGTPGSCTNAAFGNALNGGGTVTFNCGSLPTTITISEKTIAANTIIDGGNRVTLSGANAARLLNVPLGKNLTVKNLTLANGRTAGQGAAIYAIYQNSLTVSNCKFVNNVATQLGEAGGGAIYSGKGIVVIDKSSFSGNKASIGGAIRILHSNLTVTSSSFVGNKAVDANLGNGGAIYIDGANTDNGFINISSSNFQGNTATSFGGAILNSLYNNNKTTITNSVFSANSVGGSSYGQAGAIWSTGDPARGANWTIYANNTALTITNSTLVGNNASKQGGGIWIARHKSVLISNSTINGNTALSSMGGGIVQGDVANLSIVNSTISDNKVYGPSSMGAGMYIKSTAKASITNSTIANNTASWQAGGIFGGLNVTLKNTILANNVALNGGNIWNIKHNCLNAMTNGGGNLQFPKPVDNAPCTPGILIADPKLDALKNNGGPTLTRALLPGSAASRSASACPATDQRGVARPKPAGTLCDIGAFEAAF